MRPLQHAYIAIISATGKIVVPEPRGLRCRHKRIMSYKADTMRSNVSVYAFHHQWPSESGFKAGRREVPGSISGLAYRPSCSEFFVFFSETSHKYWLRSLIMSPTEGIPPDRSRPPAHNWTYTQTPTPNIVHALRKMIQKFETAGKLGISPVKGQKKIPTSSIGNVATAVIEASSHSVRSSVNV